MPEPNGEKEEKERANEQDRWSVASNEHSVESEKHRARNPNGAPTFVGSAMLATYAPRPSWPPKYTTWRATGNL